MTQPNVFLTGVSFDDEETITPEEWSKLKKWYEDCHGIGNLDLVRFMPFLVEHRPDALKKYRRFLESWTTIEGGLPPAAFGLYWLHYYTRIGFPKGVLYIIIAARHWGVSKAAIKDVLALAFVSSGPLGANTWGDVAEDYMRAWPDDDPGASNLWPAHWSTDPSCFASGMNFASHDLADDEVEALKTWHRRWQGEVPAYIDFTAKHLPRILKACRNRYEYALKGGLPVQMVPLLHLHVAAIEGRGEALARLALHAKALGVSKGQVLQAISLAFLYTSEAGMDTVVNAVGPVIEQW